MVAPEQRAEAFVVERVAAWRDEEGLEDAHYEVTDAAVGGSGFCGCLTRR